MVLEKAKFPDFFKYKPIEVIFSDKKNFIFYKESIIYQNISTLIDQSSDQFIGEITNNTSLLPIVLLDKNKKRIQTSNIPEDIKADKKKFDDYVRELTSSQEPIVLDIEPRNTKYLYYQSSNLASCVKWFPIVLYSVLAAILFLAFAAIRNVRK